MNQSLPLTPSRLQAAGASSSGVYAVVDDDEALCAALSLWLEIAGVRSERFGSAEQLLKRFARRGAPVGDATDTHPSEDMPLLGAVIDINLPGMNGIALAEALRQRVPTLPLVLITALAAQDRAPYGALPIGVLCLKKPFEMSELMEALCPSSK